MAILFVERLTIVDFSYLDQRRGLVGESWLLDLELEGELNSQAMIFDFSLVKKTVKQWIDRHIDHKLLVPGASSGYYQTTSHGKTTLTFRMDSGDHIKHIGPEEATRVINGIAFITPDAVANYAQSELKKFLPDNIDKITIKFNTEEIEGAYYQYSHGLEKHQGNCQRIAHGHRSKIKILVDNSRSSKWESYWADKLRDIYIASEFHQKPSSLENYSVFTYEAEQGKFSLELNADSCYLIPTESTVEQIAIHIAQETSKLTNGKIVVYAYEGVGKGSVAKA